MREERYIRYLLIFIAMATVVAGGSVFAADIAVLAADGSQLRTIPLREFESGIYLSLTAWADAVEADLEWDYVTGVAEMRFRDNRLRWVESGKGAWVNGRMHSMSDNARQVDGDMWLPIRILDDLVDPLWEGDLTWDSNTRTLRRLQDRTGAITNTTDLADRGDVVIVLDAGHGGDDYGVTHSSGKLEKDITLNIITRLSDVLMNRMGVRAVITRPGDYAVSMDERISAANQSRADLFISLHIAPDREMPGKSFMIYYPMMVSEGSDPGQLVPWEAIPEAVVSQSQVSARKFGQSTAASATESEFGVLARDLRIFHGLSMSALVVELSWDSSFYGDLSVASDGGYNRAAEALFDGLKSVLSQEGQRGQ